MNHVICSRRFEKTYRCKVSNDYITTHNYRGKSVSAEVAYQNINEPIDELINDRGLFQVIR